jgi:hypothetical protein
MTRYARRQHQRPRPPRHQDEPDAVELLSDIRDLLLAILACQACPACGGFGNVVDGRQADGSPQVARCPCRVRGQDLCEQFEGEE